MLSRWLVFVMAVSLFTGCTTSYKGAPRIDLGPIEFERLTESEFEITGDVSGTANGGRFLFFGYGDGGASGQLVPLSYKRDNEVSYLWLLGGIYGLPFLAADAAMDAPEPWESAYHAAVYDALEGNGSGLSADAMLAPRFSVEKTTYVPLIWTSWKANASGAAIRITKDAK